MPMAASAPCRECGGASGREGCIGAHTEDLSTLAEAFLVPSWLSVDIVNWGHVLARCNPAAPGDRKEKVKYEQTRMQDHYSDAVRDQGVDLDRTLRAGRRRFREGVFNTLGISSNQGDELLEDDGLQALATCFPSGTRWHACGAVKGRGLSSVMATRACLLTLNPTKGGGTCGAAASTASSSPTQPERLPRQPSTTCDSHSEVSSPCYDTALVHKTSRTLVLVAAEADLAHVDARSALLQHATERVSALLAETKVRVRAELWVPVDNQYVLSRRKDAGMDSEVVEEEEALSALVAEAGCVRVKVSLSSASPWVSTYMTRSQDVAARLAALLASFGATGADTQQCARQLIPWLVNIARQHHHDIPRSGTISPAPPKVSVAPSSRPLPPKEASLFGVLVFPPAVRQGYQHLQGEGAVLPEVVMSFVNAKGAPVFMFDDEALGILWKLVPALNAAVAVYDEGQRQELVRRLHVWRRQTTTPPGAVSEQDAAVLETGLPSRIYDVERALYHLYEKEVLDASTSDTERGRDGAAPQDTETAMSDPLRDLELSCTAARVWPLDAKSVLSHRGTLSLRPVPPLMEVKGTAIKAPPQGTESAAASVGGGQGVAVEASEAPPTTRVPRDYPHSFLSFALTQVSLEGVDRCEAIAYDVFQTMRRLVSRQ